jgi:Pyridoxamine 5'-phosphate oxidase
VGKQYDAIDGRLREWVEAQHVFFVATAPLAADGHVNLSPRGLRDTFRVLGPTTVAWLDLTGSGAETIAHLRENGRIVVMFCAFEGPPKIVRLHGSGRAVLPGDDGWDELVAAFGSAQHPGVRAVIVVDVTRISDSCGYAVPTLRFAAERDILDSSNGRKTDAELTAYRDRKNAASIDGLPALPVSTDETAVSHS